MITITAIRLDIRQMVMPGSSRDRWLITYIGIGSIFNDRLSSSEKTSQQPPVVRGTTTMEGASPYYLVEEAPQTARLSINARACVDKDVMCIPGIP